MTNEVEQSEAVKAQQTNDISLPQKKFYRQRAHSNPLNDHSFI